MTLLDSNELECYGLSILKTRHREVRRLKRLHHPAIYGHRVWTSSWLLMDYLQNQGLPHGLHIMEIGCGWGLAGIYCAKNHHSAVTSVDRDSGVFPFLELHSGLNQVTTTTLKMDFNGLTEEHLRDVDVLIGADICFWDEMVETLDRLIHRALAAGVRMILIADPGRTTFEELGKKFAAGGLGHSLDWRVCQPYHVQGRILKVGSLFQA